ncbi:myosin heavy chain, striated muscle isoform X2 [Toxorhynchites rutilus septentrionalis]|nr:myosin heavy chain, striated muscle isoform X2 [Toxorhynchites rutilus septentrionalis]
MSGDKRNDYYYNETGNGYGFPTHADACNLFYSTPIKGQLGNDHNAQPKDQRLLHEIDQFLQDGNQPASQGVLPVESRKSLESSLIDINSVSVSEFPSLTNADFNGFAKPVVNSIPQKPPRKDSQQTSTWSSLGTRAPMLSLNDIWKNNAINQESSKVQEERLRRQHCERNIHALQAKLLEYEQKIAVAIDVDKEKEAIIHRLEEESTRFNNQIRDLELKHVESHEKLMHENLELKNKNLFLEKELSETIAVVRKLQDKNEMLESKVECLTTANRDVTDVHKNQLKDLEIRLSNSRDNERGLRDQLSKLKKTNDQLTDELEAERKKGQDTNKLRADFASLKVKTDNLSRKFSDANTQNASCKEQIKDLKSQVEFHSEEKKNLLKELDVQRMSLKKYYQSQLEDVVADKLKEFQKQLSSVEEHLKTDAKKKERLLAERAIKQIEMINNANEQEIKLLNEKYDEQEALYRLQLTNSSKTIHELEEKLASYQNRRVDIASQLHSIMEAQWQKALEVLTSPARNAGLNENDTSFRFSKLSVDHIDKDQLDGVGALKSFTDNCTSFQTPVSSRHHTKQNSCAEKTSLPRDLLHNYIELLLEKTPNDLKELETVLTSCRKETKGSHEKVQTGNKQHAGSTTSLSQLSRTIGKPPRPWK